jgi:hypothetical protein
MLNCACGLGFTICALVAVIGVPGAGRAVTQSPAVGPGGGRPVTHGASTDIGVWVTRDKDVRSQLKTDLAIRGRDSE